LPGRKRKAVSTLTPPGNEMEIEKKRFIQVKIIYFMLNGFVRV
jgi:hypothetical protein